MPLIAMSSAEAIGTRKSNREATWPVRGDDNRIEPVARPRIDPQFQLHPGSTIFTVGSCFARNIERELAKRGFRLPVRELFKTPEFEGIGLDVINNFGSPSIYNEFAWALDPEHRFVPEQHFFEVQAGKYLDVHLGPNLRPEPWEAVLRRREGIIDAYRSVTECSIVIMTLGLSEVWFDTVTGFYLNHIPRPSLVRASPERFQLHVLSYQEAADYLFRALELLQRFCTPVPQVLLTVSPVPLTATHRPVDVAIANSYSKSVLRAAAEEACVRFPFVSYYPSYEAVTLSARDRAWTDDQVHVTDEIVAVQVARMVEAYVPRQQFAVDFASLGVEEAVERARASPGAPDVDALFSACSGRFAQHPEFARELGRHRMAQGDFASALQALEHAGDRLEVQVLRARCLRRMGRPRDALAFLDDLTHPQQKSHGIWAERVAADLALDRVPDALETMRRWAFATRGARGYTYLLAGRVFARTHPHEALTVFDQGLQLDPDDDALLAERQATSERCRASVSHSPIRTG